MTMREFKKYLDLVIKSKEDLINKIVVKPNRQRCKTWLMVQEYIIKELEDIRKVINS